MIIHSKHPGLVSPLPSGWSEGFPANERLKFAFVFPKAGSEPEITASYDSSGATITPLPNILEIVQRADEDYRSLGLACTSNATRHSFVIRTGRYNQINYRNDLVNRLVEGFLLEDSNPQAARPKMRFTFSSDTSVPHLDTNKIDPGEVVYFGMNLFGTLSWEQAFYVPDRSRDNPFAEIAAFILIKEQAITRPRRIPNDMLVRAQLGTFVHAKSRIPRRKQGMRVFFRNVVRRNT